MADKGKERDERLAAALRANLKRRKAQARDQKRPGTEQFETAMAILRGPDVDRELPRAAQLILAAAEARHPDAVERRAAFETRGGSEADWEKALDSLAVAAGLGSKSAMQQLILLADNRFEADPPVQDWAELRLRIPLGERLRALGGTVVHTDPMIATVEGMASPAECECLIAAAMPRLGPALLLTNPPRPDPGRTNLSAWFKLAELDVIVEMIRTRIARTVNTALPSLEISQVLRYRVGEEFRLHCDFLNPEAKADEIARDGQRAMTALIYLNDDFDEGETSFPELGLKLRVAKGDALIFANVDRNGRPDLRTKHAGLPPTRGEKWVFSQWIRGRFAAS